MNPYIKLVYLSVLANKYRIYQIGYMISIENKNGKVRCSLLEMQLQQHKWPTTLLDLIVGDGI